MARPNFKVTKTDGDTGRQTTVGRHTTAEAARASQQAKRADRETGSSDGYGVAEIRHRR
jgi:hypothetical protein